MNNQHTKFKSSEISMCYPFKQITLVNFFKNKYKTILCNELKILTCLSIEVCDLTVESIEFDKITIKFQLI